MADDLALNASGRWLGSTGSDVSRGRPSTAHSTGGPEASRILTTRTGLVIPAGLSFADWVKAGHVICRAADSFAWCLGDWLLFGQTRYENRYSATVAQVGLDYQTLRNYAWVARKFPMARRRAGLSFQHHAEVASLPEAEQDHWLDQAQAKAWSRNQLRLHLRNSRRAATDKQTRTAELPRLDVPLERLNSWRRAADRANTRLDAWIVATLDQAAIQVLGS